MIEMEIPKDIRKYESKLIGPFSTRQTVCVVAAGVFALILGKGFTFLPTDMKYMLIGVLCVPILAFGWIKPYGMKLEQFLSTAITTTLLSPKKRLYMTNNIYMSRAKPIGMVTLNPPKKKKDKKEKPRAKSAEYISYK